MGTILPSILDLHPNCFVRLGDFLGPQRPVYLKLEGLNPAGSIKWHPARQMIATLEARGVMQPGQSTLIESSSGNLGVALALLCHAKGYHFVCVSDPNANPAHLAHIRQYGGEVIVVTERDHNGGYLHTRLACIQQMLRDNPSAVWTNQYANAANPQAHERITAPDILSTFPQLDYLFLGAGTTGTLVGCARYLRQHAPQAAIVAVDSVGSVTFGTPPGPRYIPGLGSSRPPEISAEVASLRPQPIRDLVMIPEADTIRMCYEVLARYSLWVGGSTGTVLCGLRAYQERLPAQATVVAVSPDLGERYADTVYNPAWVEDKFGLHIDDLMTTEVAL